MAYPYLSTQLTLMILSPALLNLMRCDRSRAHHMRTAHDQDPASKAFGALPMSPSHLQLASMPCPHEWGRSIWHLCSAPQFPVRAHCSHTSHISCLFLPGPCTSKCCSPSTGTAHEAHAGCCGWKWILSQPFHSLEQRGGGGPRIVMLY